MENEKIYRMEFSKVYRLLVNKAEKKGRTQQEVDEVIHWLTGYNRAELERLSENSITYEDFFLNAPLESQQAASFQWGCGLESTAKCVQGLQYICVFFTQECVNLMCVSFGWPCLEMVAGKGCEHHFEGELF